MPKLARREVYHAYLGSTRWRSLRIEVLERDGNACAKCGSPHFLQVHHLTYERIFEEELSDLLTLCKSCHDLQHPAKKKKKRKKPNQRRRRARRRARAVRPLSTPTVKKKKNQGLIDMNDELHRKQQEARALRAERLR